MTLKVGTGDVHSARAVGDAKLGHINLDRIGRLVKNGLLNELEDDSLSPCESCLDGKMTKRPFIGKGYRAKEPLELIHSDLCGPMNLMEHKSEALEKFKEYKAEVENLLIETAVHILNNVPSKSVSETPFELSRGRKSSLSHFKIWGCPAHVLVTNPKKLEPRSRKDKCVKAMDLEIESMYFNSLRKLIDLPKGVKPIGCKSIYKRKRDSAGKSIRIPLSIATFYDYEICQMDVKTAFLNGNLKESIFMSQPEEFITQGQEQKVCKLNRFIYWLKQASRSWNIRHGVQLSKEQCPKTPQEVEDMRRIPYASAVARHFLCSGNSHGAVANSKEPRSHKRGKHIERKYHLIREIVQQGDVIVTKIASEQNIADPFTKTLTAKVFEGHLESLALSDMYIR
ncbi:putative polyprotein [Cucumis melo var. makuwa]|uniref:Putative polyprotein n=1 Tax=Cucumis melo var. makuwa TaxID=1194695 RepID=A0A5D3BY02_CUCMM|nr:putative polyprotein [Cucumis melo var. makuwa]